jgi:hypothetical protein
MGRTTKVVGALLLICIVLSSLTLHGLRTEASANVLSNDKEAYFFVNTVARGVKTRWIFYPAILVLEWLGGVESPSDVRRSLVVIHVTQSSIDRNVVEVRDNEPGMWPKSFTPLEGRVWANYPEIGGLCWWAGDHFEPATEGEKQRIGHLPNSKSDDGWSKDSQTVDLGSTHLRMSGDGFADALTITEIGPNRAQRVVYQFNPRAGRIDAVEYEKTFVSN